VKSKQTTQFNFRPKLIPIFIGFPNNKKAL